MRKYLKELKIFIKKLTHAWRVAGSRAKDAAGVDDKVCTGSLHAFAMFKLFSN